jgi:hypothetical protein
VADSLSNKSSYLKQNFFRFLVMNFEGGKKKPFLEDDLLWANQYSSILLQSF